MHEDRNDLRRGRALVAFLGAGKDIIERKADSSSLLSRGLGHLKIVLGHDGDIALVINNIERAVLADRHSIGGIGRVLFAAAE